MAEEETLPQEEAVLEEEEGVRLEIGDEAELEKAKADYGAGDLQVLEGLEAVRKRPGMYIATTASAGLHHLVWEIVDNSIDEALAGYCKNITVIIHKGNSITVTDDGRGVPVDTVAKTGLSGVETVFTILHAGGKFGGDGGYKVSGGLHGVGASVVNALSTWLEVTVCRDGGKYFMRFENGGHAVQRLARIGDSDQRGTSVTFQPDPTIFTETTVYDYETIKKHLRQMAFLNGGISLTLIDERGETPVQETFLYEGGIREYVSYLNSASKAIHPTPIYFQGAEESKIAGTEEQTERVYAEIAIQWTDAYTSDSVFSYCNNITTKEGGTHVDGFNFALRKIINEYAHEKKILKPEENFETSDCREGLTAVISVKHPNPQYEGQTKTKLGNSNVRGPVRDIVYEGLKTYLYENPTEAAAILDKISLASKARRAAKAARERIRSSGLEITTLPGKLADCSSRDPVICELFIVEGNSAGGSAKSGRDRETQAILPLRGKILNVEKAREERIWANAEIGNMISAIGAGIRENFDVTKIRYHKIIIMTDADVDGDHIRILLLTFFYRFMRPLIEGGYVYIAQPPLYKVDYKGSSYYAYNDAQLEKLRRELNLKPGFAFQRYKGLGEMDYTQLWETTMDPKARKLIRITIDDAAEAEKAFTELMGDEVDPRRRYIAENAVFVKNLDI